MFFGIIRIIVRIAPVRAFGAMAFTVGAYGLGALWNLIALKLRAFSTSLLFVLLVLGAIARLSGFDHSLHRLHQGRFFDRPGDVVIGDECCRR